MGNWEWGIGNGELGLNPYLKMSSLLRLPLGILNLSTFFPDRAIAL